MRSGGAGIREPACLTAARLAITARGRRDEFGVAVLAAIPRLRILELTEAARTLLGLCSAAIAGQNLRRRRRGRRPVLAVALARRGPRRGRRRSGLVGMRGLLVEDCGDHVGRHRTRLVVVFLLGGPWGRPLASRLR